MVAAWWSFVANATPFAALTEAPRTGYDSAGIAIDAGAVYIVRTRTDD
jgi:hypothetical protein